MQQISKHRIIPGFNKREPIATEWVCDHYLTPIYVIVKRITGDSPETDDLVQETFLTLLNYKNPFESLRKLEYFLYTTAKNISLDHRRHQLTIREKSDEVVEYYLSISNGDDAVRAAEQAAAFHHLVQLANEILPWRCKEVFNLCYIDQMKNAEIARKLGIEEKTVANLKLNAYGKLKSEIITRKHPYLMDFLSILLL